MHSANMFILEWVLVVANAAAALYHAAEGRKWLALICASGALPSGYALWIWTVTP